MVKHELVSSHQPSAHSTGSFPSSWKGEVGTKYGSAAKLVGNFPAKVKVKVKVILEFPDLSWHHSWEGPCSSPRQANLSGSFHNDCKGFLIDTYPVYRFGFWVFQPEHHLECSKSLIYGCVSPTLQATALTTQTKQAGRVQAWALPLEVGLKFRAAFPQMELFLNWGLAHIAN